ncbi:acyl-CoA dehydratase activase [Methanococcus voltae]|uniref:CoA-substrate-specific enzyme activase n=2 Tax=Methanococcus voltae TaxID=2188 RepID=A0ABT2EXP1_METVO|nr:acyl-CoA dehydratase activase [Methanococcus voltae]MBP2172447.1 putative CoA-substrate-specific enzyme activase [Methanococcus voltae]MBP2201646.1 putative CoA-substrate-specific enzyme activase [Methanococcus voltae]MCS3922434.1 putative CoA-substrate-specific enzyme activase [Methanococcus voltae PS]
MILGIDIGSTTTKTVLMDENNNKIIDYSIDNIGVIIEEEMIMDYVKKYEKNYSVDNIVATGYGRHKLSCVDKVVPEVIALGKGANYFFPNVDGLIDIGGQDSKVIKLGKDGKVVDFILSDKCAAGTGKFLEKSLDILKIDKSEDLYKYKSEHVAKISSMCAVFAETEIISLLSKKTPKEDILMGVYESIANRTIPMVHRLKINEIAFSGGVAKNPVLREVFETKIGKKLHVSEEPQITCCVGACLLI